MFNKPKYDWELIISQHNFHKQQELLIYLAKVNANVTRVRTNDFLTILTLDINRKSNKQIEEIKSNLLSLGYRIDSCTNKGLTKISWWNTLIDNFLFKEVEQEYTERLVNKKKYYK